VKTALPYVSLSLGSGYILANKAYHVDFYNKRVATTTVQKGNNGHGNDPDRNDNSNPGKSNLVSDTTDADGLPPGFSKKAGTSPTSTTWTEKKSNPLTKVVASVKEIGKRMKP
jgi:hypothetical protein